MYLQSVYLQQQESEGRGDTSLSCQAIWWVACDQVGYGRLSQ